MKNTNVSMSFLYDKPSKNVNHLLTVNQPLITHCILKKKSKLTNRDLESWIPNNVFKNRYIMTFKVFHYYMHPESSLLVHLINLTCLHPHTLNRYIIKLIYFHLTSYQIKNKKADYNSTLINLEPSKHLHKARAALWAKEQRGSSVFWTSGPPTEETILFQVPIVAAVIIIDI